jgi:glycosyltransferase involved in cell wall biosynthesis
MVSPDPTQAADRRPTLSVVICAHNPRAAYLDRTLHGLEQQTMPKDCWELLLIDNASDIALAGRWSLAWHPNGRIEREEELGLTMARIRGIRESSAALIVFVDDDNVLDAEYLARAVDVAARHPGLGCFGAGAITAEFEVTPPPEVVPHTRLLALREVAHPSWSTDPDADLLPWGPGLVVRRAVATAFADLVGGDRIRTVIGRRGDALTSGEDELFSWVAHEQGLGRGAFPELRVVHLIPKERIAFDYLLRLHRAQGKSYALLRAWQGRTTPVPERPPRVRDILQRIGQLDAAGARRSIGDFLASRRVDPYTQQMNEAWRLGIEDYFAGR